MKKKVMLILAICVALVIAFFASNGKEVEKTSTLSIQALEEDTTTIEVNQENESLEVEDSFVENESLNEEDKNQSFSEAITVSEQELDIKEEVLEEEDIKDGVYSCTLLVTCETLLSNMECLDVEKIELVPEDGIIFPATTVTFYEGESVFNVLQRELKAQKIHLEFVNTPLYNSVYIEGIHNLYEFDAGEGSGWMYMVNGYFPSFGCSQYSLEDGDVILWQYTCDLGADLTGDVDTTKGLLQGKDDM